MQEGETPEARPNPSDSIGIHLAPLPQPPRKINAILARLLHIHSWAIFPVVAVPFNDSITEAAAAEFQKLLDHRGIVPNFVTGSLAHLQIGRAYAMAGDSAKAKTAYKDFLALWKDADPDIPILKEAKAECAKLQ